MTIASMIAISIAIEFPLCAQAAFVVDSSVAIVNPSESSYVIKDGVSPPTVVSFVGKYGGDLGSLHIETQDSSMVEYLVDTTFNASLYDNSHFVLDVNGDVHPLLPHQQTTVVANGNSIFEWRNGNLATLFAQDDWQFHDSSILRKFDGYDGDDGYYQFRDNSRLEHYGGTLHAVSAQGNSTVAMLGGSIRLSVGGNSRVEVRSGSVSFQRIGGTSQMEVSGGQVDGYDDDCGCNIMSISDTAVVTIDGGSFRAWSLNVSGEFNVKGGDVSFGGGPFATNGMEVAATGVVNIHGNNLVLRDEELTGELGDGTPIRISRVVIQPGGQLNFIVPSRADLNGDGAVDAGDAAMMFANWGASGAGDLNLDGLVDAADAGEMFAVWTGDSPAAVPEPVKVGMAAFVVAFCVLCRMRPWLRLSACHHRYPLGIDRSSTRTVTFRVHWPFPVVLRGPLVR